MSPSRWKDWPAIRSWPPPRLLAHLKIYGMFFDIATAHVYEVNQNGIVRPTEPAPTP